MNAPNMRKTYVGTPYNGHMHNPCLEVQDTYSWLHSSSYNSSWKKAPLGRVGHVIADSFFNEAVSTLDLRIVFVCGIFGKQLSFVGLFSRLGFLGLEPLKLAGF